MNCDFVLSSQTGDECGTDYNSVRVRTLWQECSWRRTLSLELRPTKWRSTSSSTTGNISSLSRHFAITLSCYHEIDFGRGIVNKTNSTVKLSLINHAL